MNSIFYTGVSGMVTFQEDMNLLAHNMANVNTAGFKAGRTDFGALLYSNMAVNAAQRPKVGHGVRGEQIQVLMGQGTPQSTGRSLDFALIGDGFFAVERDGERRYTRDGNFGLSVEGRRGYLVASDGSYVLDARGRRIMLQSSSSTGAFDTEGLRDRIGVYTFENPYALQPTSGGFLATEESGRATGVVVRRGEETPYQLVESALEGSGVDLAKTMTDIMTSQRAYQFNARVVQTADQIEEILNGLR